MSNTFNITSNKARIFDLYKLNSTELNLDAEAVLLPNELKQPDKTVTAQKAVKTVLDLGLTAFRPHYVKEMTETPISIAENETLELFNELLREQQLEALERVNASDIYQVVPDQKLFIPTGPPRLMSYSPNYYNKPPDVAVLNQVTYTWLEVPGYEHLGDQVKQLSNVAKTTVLSTGTWNGQLQRLKDMQKIRNGDGEWFRPRTLQECGYSIEKMAVALEETMPITVANYIDPTRKVKSLTYLPVDYIERLDDKIIDNLPMMRGKSTAGPPFPSGYKKAACITSSVYMLSIFFKELGAKLKNTLVGDKPAGMNRLLDQFYFMYCAYMFPKEERYNRDDLMKKVRNIMAMSFPTHLALSMVLEPVTQHTLNANNVRTPRALTVRHGQRIPLKDMYRPSPSLSKFSPWHGGLNELIMNIFKMMDGGDAFIDFVYADNWYVMYRNENNGYDYYSLDLVKSEANATPDIAQAVCYYLLTRGWSTEKYIGYGPTWAYFLMNIAPAMIVDNVAIFSNLQLRVPGQSSGNTLTFQINTAVTTKARIAVYEYAEKTGTFPRPSSKEFGMVMKKVGVNIKVELEIENWDKLVHDLKTTTPRTGPLSDEGYIDDDSYIYDDVPVVPADLLGYDIAYSHILQGYVPVLEKKRLYSSIAYPKKSADDIKDHMLYKAYRIMRYSTLRIMGAWTKPVINAGVRQVGDSIRAAFEKSGMNPKISRGRVGNTDEYALAVMDELGKDSVDIQDFKFSQQFMLDLNTPRDGDFVDSTKKVSKVDMDISEHIEIATHNRLILQTPAEWTPYKQLRSYLPLASIMNRSSAKIIDAFNAAKAESDLSQPAAAARLKILTKVNKELTRQLEYAIEVLTMTIPQKADLPTMIVMQDATIANPMISKTLMPKGNPPKFIAGVSRSQKKNAKKKQTNQKRDIELTNLREAAISGFIPTVEVPATRDLLQFQSDNLILASKFEAGVPEWRKNRAT